MPIWWRTWMGCARVCTAYVCLCLSPVVLLLVVKLVAHYSHCYDSYGRVIISLFSFFIHTQAHTRHKPIRILGYWHWSNAHLSSSSASVYIMWIRIICAYIHLQNKLHNPTFWNVHTRLSHFELNVRKSWHHDYCVVLLFRSEWKHKSC